jgi:hypothetical protein
MMLMVRTKPRAVDVSEVIQSVVLTLDNGQPVFGIRTMDELMAERQAPFFGLSARSEIRNPTGARSGPRRAVVPSGGPRSKAAFIGLAIGLVDILAVTRFMTSILCHVSLTDGPTST